MRKERRLSERALLAPARRLRPDNVRNSTLCSLGRPQPPKHLWRCLNPVNRNGALLLFDEEEPARAECDLLMSPSSNSYMRYSIKLAPKPAAGPPASADWTLRGHDYSRKARRHRTSAGSIARPARDIDECCSDLLVFSRGDPDRSDRHYRTRSIPRSLRAVPQYHIGRLFRRRVLASRISTSDDANRHRVCHLVGIGDCPDHGCCLGLG